MNGPLYAMQETAVERWFAACAASHLMSCLPSPSIVPVEYEDVWLMASSHPSAHASFGNVGQPLRSEHVSLRPCEPLVA